MNGPTGPVKRRFVREGPARCACAREAVLDVTTKLGSRACCRRCAARLCDLCGSVTLCPLVPLEEVYRHLDRDDLYAAAVTARIRGEPLHLWVGPEDGGSYVQHRWEPSQLLAWLDDRKARAPLEAESARRKAWRAAEAAGEEG